MSTPRPLWEVMNGAFRAHPWHGVSIGDNAPDIVTAYITGAPTDAVRYELDPVTGLLKLVPLQEYLVMRPALYGLLPQTCSAENVAKLCRKSSNRKDIVGDNAPLDICVLTNMEINRGDILVEAVPVGGIRTINRHTVQDKIVAVLTGDPLFGSCSEIEQCPAAVIEGLVQDLVICPTPGGSGESHEIEVDAIYDRAQACTVIERARTDYRAKFGQAEKQLTSALNDMLRPNAAFAPRRSQRFN